MDGHRIREIEIAQLDLHYAFTRIERPKESTALAASIDRVGQIIPVIVVKEGMVLLDGYLRVRALKACGRDTVMAEIWDCTEEEGLVQILARAHGRKWDVVEEAALVRELHDHYHLSQGRIASLVGRTQAWVSGRLALCNTLPEDLMELVRKGSVSTWTATRVIVPIARALPEHGKLLSGHVSRTSFSTREMARFFKHYQKANRGQRERMVREPLLFLKSLHAKEEATETRILKEGPEGTWLKDFRVISHILMRLLGQVPLLFSRGQSNLDRRTLLSALEDSRARFMELEKQIRIYDDHRRNQTGHHEPPRQGNICPADRPDTRDLQEHGETRGQGEVADAAAAVPL